MRPVKNKNSAIKTPLNNIMGYEGNVRLLRCVVHGQHPMAYSELAKRTGLSLAGVHKVVPRLIKTGIIQYVGSGKHQQIELRWNHPLSKSITEFFKSEQALFNSIVGDLKKQIMKLDRKPISGWIFGTVAGGIDEYGDAVQVAILDDLQTIDLQIDEVKYQLYQSGFESTYDLTLDVRGVVKADLESRPKLVDDIILLWGIDPGDLMNEQDNSDNKLLLHKTLDERSLEDAQTWTELLKIYPEIIQRTINYLEDKMSQIDSGEKKELKEWRNILESMSYYRLKKFLKSDSERSVRLRQSLPFWQVLNKTEVREWETLKSKRLRSDE